MNLDDVLTEGVSSLLDRAKVFRGTDPDFSKPYVVFCTDRKAVFVQYAYVDTEAGPLPYLDVPAGGCNANASDWDAVQALYADRVCAQDPLGGMPHFTVACADVADAAAMGRRLLDYFGAPVVDVLTEMAS